MGLLEAADLLKISRVKMWALVKEKGLEVFRSDLDRRRRLLRRGDVLALRKVPVTEWLTIKEACLYLKLDRRTLYKYMTLGKLPYYQVGGEGTRRFKREDLDSLLVPGKTSSTRLMP